VILIDRDANMIERSNYLLQLLEFGISLIDFLYLGKEFTRLALLLLVDQTFGEESMHIVEFKHISELLLLLCHSIAEGHILEHIVGEHSVGDLHLSTLTFFLNP
jgi:hypothetical protein